VWGVSRNAPQSFVAVASRNASRLTPRNEACCAAEEDVQGFLDALDAKKIASKSIWRDHGPAEILQRDLKGGQ
jgi:hypothetical protein